MADSPSSREPSPKHSKTSVMNTFSEIFEEVGVTVSDTSGSDVDRYLSEPLHDPLSSSKCLHFVGQNGDRFPLL